MRNRTAGSLSSNDFASLLDDVIAAAEQKEAEAHAARPTIPFDLMGTIIDVPVSDPSVAAEYLFAAADAFSIEADTPPLAPDLPSTDPMEIRRELGVSGRETVEALDRIRREFAFANHPDRVPADLIDKALIRMQVANQLIDDAKRKLVRNP